MVHDKPCTSTSLRSTPNTHTPNNIEKTEGVQVQCCKSLRQENYRELEGSLDCIVSFRNAWTTEGGPVSKNEACGAVGWGERVFERGTWGPPAVIQDLLHMEG